MFRLPFSRGARPTYRALLQGAGTKNHHSPLLLDESAEPLGPLSGGQRPPADREFVLRLVTEILRALLDRRTLSRRDRAKRHRFRYHSLAAHAPIGSAVFLHVHQIPDAASHAAAAQLQIRSRQRRRVR